MKKKNLLNVLLVFLNYFSFTDNFNNNSFNNFTNRNLFYLTDDNLIFTSIDHSDNILLSKTKRYNIKRKENPSFIEIKTNPPFNGNNHIDDKIFLLEGKVLIIFEVFYNLNSIEDKTQDYVLSIPNRIRNTSISELTSIKKNASVIDENERYDEENIQIYLYEDGIKNINSSSYLIEKVSTGEIQYLEQFLLKRLFYTGGEGPFYDTITPPWVEGVKGYGIGEWLDIEFKYKSDEIQILNGYVDFRRMYLYKQNSRVKTILIESQNPKFSQEYELEDFVKYNVIKLPKKTDHIRITIKDVYKGDKYDDTCISSILITDPSKTSFEEQQLRIKKILIDSGIWEKMNN